MACYIIAYDLFDADSAEYEELSEAIKSYGTWARIAESTWAVVSDESASEVRSYLGSFMKNKDRIFVVKSGKAASWKNVRCRDEWLKNNL